MAPIELAQIASIEVTAFFMAEVRTDKAVQPAQSEQDIETFFSSH